MDKNPVAFSGWIKASTEWCLSAPWSKEWPDLSFWRGSRQSHVPSKNKPQIDASGHCAKEDKIGVKQSARTTEWNLELFVVCTLWWLLMGNFSWKSPTQGAWESSMVVWVNWKQLDFSAGNTGFSLSQSHESGCAQGSNTNKSTRKENPGSFNTWLPFLWLRTRLQFLSLALKLLWRLVPLGGQGCEQLLLLLWWGTNTGNLESAKRGCKQCNNTPDAIGKIFHICLPCCWKGTIGLVNEEMSNLSASQPSCPEPITHWPGAARSCWQAFLGGWFHLLAPHEGFHVCSGHSQGLQ